MRWIRTLAVVMFAVLLMPDALQSQGRVIQGDVKSAIDSSLLVGASIDISGPRFSKRAVSDELGKFWLGQVPDGSYRLLVMRVGFAPIRQDVVVGGGGADLHIVMSPDAQDLGAIITRANVTAVYGGVGAVGTSKNAQGEKTMTSVSGATVQVLGSRKQAVTDSIGRFFIELPKEGRFLVRMTSPGLATQLFTVDVPRNKAVDVSRLLDSSSSEVTNGRAFVWNEMDRRINARAMNSALVSGTELRELGGSTIDAVLRARGMTRRGLKIGAETCVFVDGIAKPGMPLDAIQVEEIEAIELYGPGGDLTQLLASSWPRSAPCGSSNRYVPTVNRAIPTVRYAVIWTRR